MTKLNNFSLTSSELYKSIFWLTVLLIFIRVYFLTKTTLCDICHKLSKQPSSFTLNLHSFMVLTNSTHSKTFNNNVCSFYSKNLSISGMVREHLSVDTSFDIILWNKVNATRYHTFWCTANSSSRSENSEKLGKGLFTHNIASEA